MPKKPLSVEDIAEAKIVLEKWNNSTKALLKANGIDCSALDKQMQKLAAIVKIQEMK
jgi:hypothetical protein